MRIEFFLSLFFFLIGTLGLIYGLIYEDPLLISMGAVLWVGMLFFDMMIMRQDIKGLYKEKED